MESAVVVVAVGSTGRGVADIVCLVSVKGAVNDGCHAWNDSLFGTIAGRTHNIVCALMVLTLLLQAYHALNITIAISETVILARSRLHAVLGIHLDCLANNSRVHVHWWRPSRSAVGRLLS